MRSFTIAACAAPDSASDTCRITPSCDEGCKSV